MQISNRAWAEIALLGAIWGASFVTVAVALREMGPFATVAWRTGLGAAALWAAVALARLPVPRAPRFWWACLVMGLLNNAIPFSLMAWGQQAIESGLTSILNAMTAVFGAVAAAALLRDERLGARRAAGVALGVAGVATIMGREALAGLDLRSLAQLAVLGGALSCAFASVWGRLHLSGAAPAVAAAGMTAGGALISVPMALAVEGAIPLPRSAEVWASVLCYGLAGTAGAYLLYYRILAVAGAANTMLVTLVIPPAAILLGWAILDERLAPRAFAGLGLIALGLVLLDGRAPAALARALRPARA